MNKTEQFTSLNTNLTFDDIKTDKESKYLASILHQNGPNIQREIWRIELEKTEKHSCYAEFCSVEQHYPFQSKISNPQCNRAKYYAVWL